MEHTIKQFCDHIGISQAEFSRRIGWNPNSLAQAMRNEGKSRTLLLKFNQSEAFPNWAIEWDEQKQEHVFVKQEAVPPDLSDYSKEDLILLVRSMQKRLVELERETQDE